MTDTRNIYANMKPFTVKRVVGTMVCVQYKHVFEIVKSLLL